MYFFDLQADGFITGGVYKHGAYKWQFTVYSKKERKLTFRMGVWLFNKKTSANLKMKMWHVNYIQ